MRALKVMGKQGNLVPLGEIARVERDLGEKSIYHKNLMPVVYVTGDVAGQEESPLYAIRKINKTLDQLKVGAPVHPREEP